MVEIGSVSVNWLSNNPIWKWSLEILLNDLQFKLNINIYIFSVQQKLINQKKKRKKKKKKEYRG